MDIILLNFINTPVMKKNKLAQLKSLKNLFSPQNFDDFFKVVYDSKLNSQEH